MSSPAAPLNIVFAGSGEFGLPSLQALADRHRLLCVYTQPDRPAGRGRKLTPTAVARWAREHLPGVPVVPTADLNAEPVPACDLLVVIAFGQKVAPAVIQKARLGGINLHASRLPKYRGAAPIHRAILAGEQVTGNSVIRLADKMDAGVVLGMSSVPIGELETTGELHDRLAADGAGLLLHVIDQLAAGSAVELEQDDGQATPARKVRREEALLDFTRSAELLARQVRAFYPWPGCHVEITVGDARRRATLVRARATPGEATPGEIRTDGLVGTGQGLLEVVEIQPEGGRPMPLQSYRNGHPWAGGKLCGIA
ncbi:MAG: methionyl-tRNA formyltransferase [Tepidisphaerales bacterium]